MSLRGLPVFPPSLPPLPPSLPPPPSLSVAVVLMARERSHKPKDDHTDRVGRQTLSRIYAPSGSKGNGKDAHQAETRRHKEDEFDKLSEYDKELFSKTPATT
eukprot:580119-Hanusia_phi.AAC.1